MKVTSIKILNYGNHTGVRKNPAPAISYDKNSVSFGAKGGSDKKVWPKVLLAVILVLPLVILPFVNKNNENEENN